MPLAVIDPRGLQPAIGLLVAAHAGHLCIALVMNDLLSILDVLLHSLDDALRAIPAMGRPRNVWRRILIQNEATGMLLRWREDASGVMARSQAVAKAQDARARHERPIRLSKGWLFRALNHTLRRHELVLASSALLALSDLNLSRLRVSHVIRN